jgi:hypothetical protein
LILGEAAPQPVLHTVSRIVSTQIIDAALNMAPNNQKTEVVPPQKCGRTCLCPLIQKSYSLFLFVLAVLAGGPSRERNRWRLHTSDLLHWPR